MRIHDAVQSGADRRETEILLAWVLECDRSHLLAHPEEELGTLHLARFRDALQERASGKPLSYITGEKEFYGRAFRADPRALIPRPSTEILVDILLSVLAGGKVEVRELEPGIIGVVKIFRPTMRPTAVVDVGTGSGCVAVTLALDTTLDVLATDRSCQALELARENAENHRVLDRITFMEGHLLEPLMLRRDPFIVIANLPYIPDRCTLDEDVLLHEPHSALFGGPDGFSLIRELVLSCRAQPVCTGIVVECLESQVAMLQNL